MRGFPRHTGVVPSPASGAVPTSAARSGLLPSLDQFFSFRSAFHLHGSTPHRKSGVVSGCRAKRHAAEPMKGKHDRMPCHSRWKGRCSNGWREQVRRHQVPARHQQGLRRASGSARQRLPAGRRHRLYERHPQGHDLKGHGQPDSRIRATEAGNDCDAFRSRGAGHQEGHRGSTVDIGPGRLSASRQCAVKWLDSLGLLGGVASALDVAPFRDRQRRARCAGG